MSISDGIELRCSAVVIRQQNVLLVHRTRGADDDWVLPGGTPRAVFAATDAAPGTRPAQQEPGLTPAFVPMEEIGGLDLRPPLAGHLRGMLGHRGRLYAPYLANLWRPAGQTTQAGS